MAIPELADHTFRGDQPAGDVPAWCADPQRDRHTASTDQQRGVPGPDLRADFSHRDVDYRVRVTRSARVLQHSALREVHALLYHEVFDTLGSDESPS
ncbi:hypothetical protein MT3377.1 [Mycobacterium tuberculosis CDC1551]|uniref:Uncharacterized protein n=1 Tax=Mycobacterium tuberculosis (strain CDC 1551 / Oshkosh) TaxID=83331 RepID=Q8VJ40_MYCTO|nr:hypothetical protein MT3377.1 [Mycobacterium tuberculosis CDC1551]